MSPAALSIVLTTFVEQQERNRALGIWGAIGASGAVIGAVLGGVITTYLGWRWNFFINIFIGATVVLAALRFVPADPPTAGAKRIDLPGASLVTGGLLLLVYALTQAPTYGWGAARSVVAFATSAILLAAFAVHEARASNRLVPFDIFRVRNLAAANIAYLANVAAFAAVFSSLPSTCRTCCTSRRCARASPTCQWRLASAPSPHSCQTRPARSATSGRWSSDHWSPRAE
jgi:MFS family permease